MSANPPPTALITEAMRARIGRTLNFGPPLRAETTLIRNFADALNLRRPLFTDEEYARQQGHDGLVAPPTFVQYDIDWSGTSRDGLGGVFEAAGGFHAEDDWEFLQPVVAGDTICSEGKLIGLTEKQGRAGPMLFARSEIVYTNQRDETVAIYRHCKVFFPKQRDGDRA